VVAAPCRAPLPRRPGYQKPEILVRVPPDSLDEQRAATEGGREEKNE
jgi:hypothetical protein